MLSGKSVPITYAFNKVKARGILMRHQMDLRTLHERRQIDDFQQVQIDATLVRLCDSMGRAKRIKATVFPVTYRLFITGSSICS